MTGHVYKRADGRWEGKIDLPRDPITKKRRRKSFYGKTKKEVQIKINEFIYKLQNNLFTITDPTTLTFGEYLKQWFSIYSDGANLAETTRALYQMYLDVHIIPSLGKYKLSKILPLHIQDFINEKKKTHVERTVHKYYVILNRAFKDAVANKLIPENPCDYIIPPNQRKNKFKPDVYNQDDFRALRLAVKDTIDELPVMLAAGLGLRRSEVFGLRWEDIDIENRLVKINNAKVRFNKTLEKKPKTESGIRVIPIPEEVMKVLLKYRKETGYVVDKYQPDYYSERFKKRVIEKNNLKPIRFHDLRHFYATMMLKNNVQDVTVASLMGHASVQTTKEIYQHVLEEIAKDAAETINNALK